MERRAWARAGLAAAAASAPAAALPAAQDDPFAADVRPTPWLSPAQEQAALRVPPGFRVSCFVHEPAIFKPMNLAFDARGRLWCTSSTEYPFAVGPERGFAGRDRVTIHEDADRDGVAERHHVFADGLNLPIGLYPCVDRRGRDGCIVFSVPDILALWDDDGDLVCDRRERLYGPFGWERDTHGLVNSFRRGLDGWIYACHGYRNVSEVAGSDGDAVRMESGNTFRFRPDGSRIELFARGQVNPFGSAFDLRGDLFTADCHSLPITLLLRGGCYESFGRPHDGPGFAPAIMRHSHGSTALCGLAIETAGAFPPEYAGDVFVGDVTGSRVHRDKLAWHGSTPEAHAQPDFVVSDDPWFRPVDLQFGPDGALYVADFYNRIIGHYEVALDHPGRDRTSGRIWRIAWTGLDGAAPPPDVPDLRAMDAAQLVEAFEHANLGVRMRALDELTDRLSWSAVHPAVAGFHERQGDRRRPLLLRAHERFGHGAAILGLASSVPAGLLADTGESAVRRTLMQVAAGVPDAVARDRERDAASARARLHDPDPFVARAAAQALRMTPAGENVAPLLRVLRQAPPEDALLRHAARIALRDQLADAGVLAAVAQGDWPRDSLAMLVELAAALPDPAAIRFAVDRVDAWPVDADAAQALVERIAVHAAEQELARLPAIVRRLFAGGTRRQLALCEALFDAAVARGAAPPPELVELARELVVTVLDSTVAVESAPEGWICLPVTGRARSPVPWHFERRRCADGSEAELLSSLPGGERRTGRLCSGWFPIPPRLVLWVAGHDGRPEESAHCRNGVRVVAAGGAELAAIAAPRDDVAQRVELDLAAHATAGALARLEIVDGDEGDAYAWIACGRVEPPVLALPVQAPAEAIEQFAAACGLVHLVAGADALEPALVALASSALEPARRAAAAAALAQLRGDPVAEALAPLVEELDGGDPLQPMLGSALASPAAGATTAVALDALERLPARLQLPIASALARTAEGADALLRLLEAGKAPARLLAREELREALLGARPADGARRVEAVELRVPPDDDDAERLVAERLRAWTRRGGDVARGREQFARHCAACHAIDSAGGKVAPQLDGLASRGAERVLEDLFDPNRNVDGAFRRTHLFLRDGEVVSALVRARDAAALAVVDERGAERTIACAEVVREKESALSLMPAGLDELLDEDATLDLLAFLLDRR